jgi:hypothetical protein
MFWTHKWLLYVLFIGKLPPTTKGEAKDGKHIDSNVGKGQDHNTKKSLSIFGAEFDIRSELATLGDMEVLFTYVSHPCDNKS